MTKLDRLAALLKSDIEHAEKGIEEFREKLSKDPAYALSWSDQYFRRAAELAVCRELLDAVERGVTIEVIIQSLKNAVIRNAQSPEMSTSVPSNLMSLYTNSTRALFLENLLIEVAE